jgi:TetR/AcrR family transcriptional regulator, transcriptional repressor for nem operon
MGRSSDAREKLLAAALDLIWTSSYGSVGVDQICERAGVNKGSFYHFFPSKSDLAVAAYEAYWQAKRPWMDSIFSREIDPLDRLDRFCTACYQLQLEKYQEHGLVVGCPYANLGSELATQDPKIRAKAHDLMERTLRYLEAAVADAVHRRDIPSINPRIAGKEIYSCILGALVHAKVENDPEVLRDLGDTVMRLLGVHALAA